jgi:hypothetical protein
MELTHDDTHMQTDPDLLERLELILRARFDIQGTLLEQYAFLRSTTSVLEEVLHRDAFQLLVGAAFSLWRAIFLTEAEREWPSLSEDMENFLFKVITDNAIAFGDDKKFNAWTVGYYLGSAQMRVRPASDILSGSPALREATMAANVSVVTPSRDLNPRQTLAEWQTTLNDLRRLFKVLKRGGPLLVSSCDGERLWKGGRRVTDRSGSVSACGAQYARIAIFEGFADPVKTRRA